MYVDALKVDDTIHVVERKNGKRIFQKKPAKYVFYVKNKNGKYTSIYNDTLIKYESSNYGQFKKEMETVREGHLVEHDINPVFRFLEDNYHDCEVPELNIAFFDIEVDFDPAKGFSTPHDPYCPVNAVSVYQSWTKKNVTYVLKPTTISDKQANDICAKFSDTYLCKDEDEFYDKFFEAIDDADVITGWNSGLFDIPYLVERLQRISTKERTKNFCLWNQYPRKKEFEKFGKEHITYEICGRVHLDYLDLYQKHTYHEMHSYRLDFVGEYEVGEKKTAYEGSLDKLYKYDFEKFIEYNRQDVMLLVKIDEKLKFIGLSNDLAHENSVLLNTTLGSVALIEQSIVKEIHSKGLIAPSKKHSSDDGTSVAGAWVNNPNKGMHDWIGSVDINSLYPSTIRALNISPETIIGQLDDTRTMAHLREKLKEKNATMADAWSDMFGVIEYNMVKNGTGDIVTVIMEDGSRIDQSALEWKNTIYNSESFMNLSANGTLFRTDQKGIIPGLLERWYTERVEIRKEAKDMFDLKAKLKDELKTLPENNEFYIEIKKRIEQLDKEIAFRDQRQLIKKILLNSLYGAILNPHCRFFDQRMGQSVTLTGRCITYHMACTMNELINGEYELGSSILYGDTDSSYFSAFTPTFKKKNPEFEWTKDNVMKFYDEISDKMNAAFPDFMVRAFNATPENGKIIEAGREVCAEKGMFIKKKRYAILCYDVEGRRFDTDGKPGKLKAMGIELKRSDTPKVIQDFLEKILIKVLTGSQEEEISNLIKEFRTGFREWPGWNKGSPKKVNGLTKKVELEEKLGKIAMAGHQRASMNWNKLRKMYSDNYSLEIQDGAKVVVCMLLDNPLKMNSIAYPVDQTHLPDWFKNLPFDHDGMEDALIDSKIDNIIGVLKWDLKKPEDDTTFGDLFTLS